MFKRNFVICLFTIIGLFFSFPSWAQEKTKQDKKHAFHISINDALLFNSENVHQETFHFLNKLVTNNVVVSPFLNPILRNKFIPIFNIGYTKTINKKFKWGIEYGFILKSENSSGIDNFGKNFHQDITLQAHFINGNFYYTYLQKDLFSIYSKVSLGFMLYNFNSEKRNSDQVPSLKTTIFQSYPHLQLNPLGVSIGKNRIGGFMEIGFGLKGIAELGLYVKL